MQNSQEAPASHQFKSHLVDAVLDGLVAAKRSLQLVEMLLPRREARQLQDFTAAVHLEPPLQVRFDK
jgi:hypothetical protein